VGGVEVMMYCAACGKVLEVGDFAISVHGKLCCGDACEATYESRDESLVIEANLDDDGEGGWDAEQVLLL
jgi:hypothetical protein